MKNSINKYIGEAMRVYGEVLEMDGRTWRF